MAMIKADEKSYDSSSALSFSNPLDQHFGVRITQYNVGTSGIYFFYKSSKCTLTTIIKLRFGI